MKTCLYCQEDHERDSEFCTNQCKILWTKAQAKLAPKDDSDPIDWDKVRHTIAATKRRDVIPLEEVRGRLFGFKEKHSKHTGIKGYNAYMLSVGQPNHCVGIMRLAELLTLWGCDAMKWLKGEAKGVAYVPAPSDGLGLP